ncbi:MAG: exonuclease III [Pseudohongiellaceae bacterium]|jgi:exonuclease III
MRRIFITLVLLLAASLTQAELNVMTINTEWLWTPYDRQVDGGRYNKGDMSALKYEEELAFYASVVKRKSVQILAVSEIENYLVAQNLAKAFGVGWRAYFKQGRDTATGQDVAILSNLEPVEGSLTDFDFPGGKLPRFLDKQKRLSKIVGVQFWSDSGKRRQKIGVITSHFLSKRKENKKKYQNRQRQAYALVKTIEKFIHESDSLVVMGDFNDHIRSETLAILMKKHQLLSAEVMIKKANKTTLNKQALRRIDHILYRNLRIKDFKIVNLKKYSDHDGIFAQFY